MTDARDGRVVVGHDVVGFDLDKNRVDRLGRGESFIDDITDDDLTAAVRTGRYTATDDPAELAGFSTAVVCVPTPLRDGAPDLSYITWGLQNTPKIVSGIDDASAVAVTAFYDSVVDRTVPAPGTREAELAKLLENTFRHVNIALVNELAMYCHELGIDVWSVIEMAASKPFGFMKFTPGPGVGGHCLPIDPSYLSWQVRRALGRTFRFVEIANDVNDNMPGYVVTRVVEHLNRRRLAVNGSRVLLVGLTYKRNSGTC